MAQIPELTVPEVQPRATPAPEARIECSGRGVRGNVVGQELKGQVMGLNQGGRSHLWPTRRRFRTSTTRRPRTPRTSVFGKPLSKMTTDWQIPIRVRRGLDSRPRRYGSSRYARAAAYGPSNEYRKAEQPLSNRHRFLRSGLPPLPVVALRQRLRLREAAEPRVHEDGFALAGRRLWEPDRRGSDEPSARQGPPWQDGPGGPPPRDAYRGRSRPRDDAHECAERGEQGAPTIVSGMSGANAKGAATLLDQYRAQGWISPEDDARLTRDLREPLTQQMAGDAGQRAVSQGMIGHVAPSADAELDAPDRTRGQSTVQYFQSKGLPAVMGAGIAANLYAESGISANPKGSNDGGAVYGSFQAPRSLPAVLPRNTWASRSKVRRSRTSTTFFNGI